MAYFVHTVKTEREMTKHSKLPQNAKNEEKIGFFVGMRFYSWKKKIFFFLYLDNLYTNGKNLNEIICDIKGHIIRN